MNEDKAQELEDKVRKMIIDALETALAPDDPEVRVARLTGFVAGEVGVYVDNRGVRVMALQQTSPN